jgi:hypothetical protein
MINVDRMFGPLLLLELREPTDPWRPSPASASILKYPQVYFVVMNIQRGGQTSGGEDALDDVESFSFLRNLIIYIIWRNPSVITQSLSSNV